MATKKIILQKGHVAPREPGHEGATGATGEQETVHVLVDETAALLKADERFSVKVIPGRIPTDVRNVKNVCDAFISFHCDGSTDKTRDGWGIGYPAHDVNKALSTLLGQQIAEFHRSNRLRDNYSRNMSGYYAWNDLDIDGPEILVEHGFSSNPTERTWMVRNKAKFAEAYRDSLVSYFKLAAIEPPLPAAVRRAGLRKFILAAAQKPPNGAGWTWAKIKATKEWEEYVRLGGN